MVKGKKHSDRLTMFAKTPGWSIIRPMKLALWILPSCAVALFMSSCANHEKTTSDLGTPGPFDSRGNYVEEWADNPSKWRRPGRAPSPHDVRSDELPEIVMNDQPPANSIPLPPPGSSKPQPVISKTVVTNKPKPTERKSEPVVVKSTKPRVTEERSTAAKSSSTKPTASTKSSSTKSSSKTVAKAKPKPKSTRYTVKQGDSLSAIASRNGTSVSALKSANGISGTTIHPGQSLTIPKK